MLKTIEQSAPASFFQRVCAYLLDRIILLIALIPLWVGKLFQPELNLAVLFRFTWADLIGWGIATLYFVLTTRLLGGTFGKLAFRLRVTREDGSKLGFWTILLRETAGRYLSGILCIGYFIALFHSKHKALHDM
ncbi:MAG: RDD family protein, partial [Candidatus Methanomethylophilaceae archaeon]|nr:RDD family protein [Candidatus Methanomethylophilaceae archaeon]